MLLAATVNLIRHKDLVDHTGKENIWFVGYSTSAKAGSRGECNLTVSLNLCCSKSNTRGASRALEGQCVSSKSPSGFRDRTRELL